MSRRTVEDLVKRIREEIRAEAPDSAGYSDFIILDGINSAIADLSEVFPVRDSTSFTTEADTNEYTLSLDSIYNIIKVEYDGTVISGMPLDDYLSLTDKTAGGVLRWVLWGTSLVLVGEVEEDKTVNLWVTRAPNKVDSKDSVPELPSYADEAIVAYALSICYRESRNFDRADYYYRIYVIQKSNILRRGVPQRQKDHLPKMNDSYWGAFRPSRKTRTSDTNPGGRI
jgi:hypothetical protein